MPRPPPPIAAFMMTGNPALLANLRADCASVMGSLEPGTVGTPHSSASLLAMVLSPMAYTNMRVAVTTCFMGTAGPDDTALQSTTVGTSCSSACRLALVLPPIAYSVEVSCVHCTAQLHNRLGIATVLSLVDENVSVYNFTGTIHC